jgi:ERCC4-type nuclease
MDFEDFDIIIEDDDEEEKEEAEVKEVKEEVKEEEADDDYLSNSKYVIQITIDCREKSLIKSCQEMISKNKKFNNILLRTKNLELGDIIISDMKNKEHLIIERKTIQDLLSSIKDNRYREQSFRLTHLDHPNHNIIYLIEGDNINDFYAEKDMIYSSMFSLSYFKGFSLFRTKDVKETSFVLCNAAYKINKEDSKTPYYNNITNKTNDEKSSNEDYTSVIKKKKNSNITPENFGEIVLIQIPSVSNTTAKVIMDEFKTLNNLVSKLKENKNCLNDLSYLTSKNQKRKLNKTCLKNIQDFLLT